MIQQDHLQVYDLVLTTRSPLFVGSGQEYTKKEYLYNPKNNMVSFLDQEKFFSLLAEKGLIDAYEDFMLGPGPDLYCFLTKDCGIPSNLHQEFIRYRVSAAEALAENRPLREIKAFQRDPAGRAYVPGSSVKGALRTAWLLSAVLEDARPNKQLAHPKRRNDGAPFPEEQYLNQLSLDSKKKENAVNDLFRGVQVSDSMPVPDNAMILAGKTDALPGGGVHSIPLCRECVRPGIRLRFKLTLDTSVLKERVTDKTLLDAINRYDQYYTDTYLPHFTAPRGAVSPSLQNCLILGGGAGFFSKSLAYPYLGKKNGLEWTAEEMSRMFQKHGHQKDKDDHRISPHTAKYTTYQQRLYPYGICEVTLK